MKPSFKLFMAGAFALGILACNSESKNELSNNTDVTGSKGGAEEIQPVELSEMAQLGKPLMEMKCNACHNDFTPEADRIAPPMAGIQRNYKRIFQTKEEFIKAMVDYATNPNEAKAKLPHAIKRFGPMPKLGFQIAETEKIATYIYEASLKMPKAHDMTQCEPGMMGKGMGNKMKQGVKSDTLQSDSLASSKVASDNATTDSLATENSTSDSLKVPSP